jgi:hypothetical protein
MGFALFGALDAFIAGAREGTVERMAADPVLAGIRTDPENPGMETDPASA